MPRVTNDQIDALLRDPEFPWARTLRMGNERAVQIEGLIAFARSRGLPTTHLEEAVDSYVHAIGGRRERALDPWSTVPNLVRRLTGALPRPPLELWVVPVPWDRR